MYDIWDDNLKSLWASFTGKAAIDNWVFRLHYMATQGSKDADADATQETEQFKVYSQDPILRGVLYLGHHEHLRW